ncbi:hypothetical protein [Ferrimonas lipolytica]|uniref:Uncharacterized protein n=1 Tax=Ferrimonas lipolytica TaxID=2724191 RepID=A0A6H1UCP3_9GAMM|nr:hypothetical protein [Ferrimonas lipolytica]QIZ76409.1 hypothetical protein HER31_05765 [Ferrimonas lipolytica]
MKQSCHTFKNRYGEQWLNTLVTSRGITRLMAPHSQLLDGSRSWDLQLCWEVLASAEVIAACYSHNHQRIPASAQRWLNRRQGLYARRCKISAEQARLAFNAALKVIEHPQMKQWCCCNACGQTWQRSQRELLSMLSSTEVVR